MCRPLRKVTRRQSLCRVCAAAEHVKQSSLPPTRWRSELQPKVNIDEEDDVGDQHERPDADAEMQRAVRASEEEGAHRVVGQEAEDDRRQVEEEAVGVHEDVGKRRFAAIAAPRRGPVTAHAGGDRKNDR